MNPKWRRYLRFWGSDIGADAGDELGFHIELRVRDFIALGMTPEDARAEALRRFGNIDEVRARCVAIDRSLEHDRKRAHMWDAIQQDLRYAGRALRRSPGFTITAVITLALGIGANTAIFSVVNGVLLRPLPFREPERLVALFTAFRGSGDGRYSMSQPEFLDYKGLTHTFENAAAYDGAGLTLTGNGEPERVRGLAATRDLLPVLGISPLRGRNFEGDEGRQGTEPVIIVSNEFVENRFGGDPSVLGRLLTLNGIARRVIGILPPGRTFQRAEAIIPMFINPDSTSGRSYNYLSGVARLQPGVTVEQAQRDLNALTRRTAVEFKANYPASMGYGAAVVGLHDDMVGDAKRALLILLGAVGLVLLIACANVANLLLARGEARHREIAMRLALGANRSRIVRQLLTESSALALIGGAAGLLLAWAGVKGLLALDPAAIPRLREVRVDALVGGVTLAVALVTGILFGIAPAMQMVKAQLHSTLKEGWRGGSESGQQHRLGRALVSAELALAVVVVIGAGLLMRSFWELRNTEAGFSPDRVLAIDLALPEARYDVPQTTLFYKQLVERLDALPGVETAAATSDLPPVASSNNWDIQIDGRPPTPGVADPSPNVRIVTPEYFKVMSMTMVRGRSLGVEDTQGAMSVAVVNESAARTIWPGADPIGQRIRFSVKRPWTTIVGIARDVRSMGLAMPPSPELFLVHEQLPVTINSSARSMYVVLRAAGDPMTLAKAARQIVREADPLLAIISIRSMPDIVSISVAQPRFTMMLLGIFGAVALSLAAIGIYGVLAYAVKRRTREIGIRIALGGQPRHVLWLVVAQGMRLAVVGLIIGILGALMATQLMTKVLYGVSATDGLTFVGVIVVLTGVALVASWIPARRAVRTDPRTALASD